MTMELGQHLQHHRRNVIVGSNATGESQLSGKQGSVDVPSRTMGEALAGLVSQHPELKGHLYTDEGELRAFINVCGNDEDMRCLQKVATTPKVGDTISIVPSIAGGCGVGFVGMTCGLTHC